MRFRERKTFSATVANGIQPLSLTPMTEYALATQVVLDEATLFTIAVDPISCRRGWGVCCLSI